MVTSVHRWIRLGVPGKGRHRRYMHDVVPLWIFFHVRLFSVLRLLFLSHDRWIYASTLAYIVDANVGRSSTAVATNSSFRGLFAFVAAEVAVPLQVSRSHPPQNILSEAHIGCYWGPWFVHNLGGRDSRHRMLDSAGVVQG
jgi:hypothetical protein